MHSLVFLPYFFPKVIEENPLGGRIDPPPPGRGRVKHNFLFNVKNQQLKRNHGANKNLC